MIIKNLKKHWLYYIVGILFCSIIYYLAYTYSLVYDDIDFSYVYPNTGWRYFNLKTILSIAKNYYHMNGRIGHGFIYFFIHFKILSSILSILCVSVLFILAPTVIAYNNQSDKKYNFLKNCIISFGIMSLFTLFFPFQFYIINDFFIKTQLLTYILPMVIAWLFVILTWHSIMNQQIIIIKNQYLLYCVSLFSFSIGFLSSIHSELLSIYMIGMIIGIYILAFIKYKKQIPIPHFIISLYSGIILGTILILTSPGILSALFNPEAFRKSTTFTNVLLLLSKELSFVSIICFGIICILGIILYLLFRKNNIKATHQSELIWKTSYLFCIYLGFVLILFITRIPYFRALIIAAAIVPLVYLIILLVVSICELLPRSINYIILSGSSIIIVYLILITLHNSLLIKNIDNDFTTRMNNFQESQDMNNGKFVIPIYTAPFKHIVNRNYQTTSDMGHGFSGPKKEYQLLGGRLFIHVIHPQVLKNLYWSSHLSKIGNRDNVDFDDKSLTNHITSPIKFLN